MVIRRRSLLLAGVAVPVAAARSQCVTDTPAVDACRGGVRTTVPYGATLDLSFGAPALDARLTFSRASTATYFDSSGVMQTAATNAPRFDYDPVTHAALGLLIEDTRTNLMLQSADVSNAAWNKSGSVTPPTVTANQAVAPDGTMTAARVTYVAVSAGNWCQINQTPTLTANPYSFSIWMRGNVGGEQLYLMLSPNGSTFNSSPVMTLTTSWQRFVFNTPTMTAVPYYCQIGVDLRDGTQTAKPAQTVFIWGAQMEQGAFPTSYVGTTAAAVVRAQDRCTIQSANMAGWFNGPLGSWFVEFIRTTNPLPGDIHIISGPTEGNALQVMTNQGNGCLQTFDGNNWCATANTITANTVSKGASTWAAGTGQVCLNGGVAASTSMTGGFSGLASSGVGFLTTSPTAGSANNMSGYIRRVRYWPRVLSNAEMQSVTR